MSRVCRIRVRNSRRGEPRVAFQHMEPWVAKALSEGTVRVVTFVEGPYRTARLLVDSPFGRRLVGHGDALVNLGEFSGDIAGVVVGCDAEYLERIDGRRE